MHLFNIHLYQYFIFLCIEKYDLIDFHITFDIAFMMMLTPCTDKYPNKQYHLNSEVNLMNYLPRFRKCTKTIYQKYGKIQTFLWYIT